METKVTSPHNHNLTGLLFVVAAAFAFSTKAIIIKLAYAYGSHITPIMLMSLRMIMALPFFIVIIYALNRKKQTALNGKDKIQLLLFGIIGFYLAAYLDFVGLSYISASLERLVLLLYPTLVVLISAVIFRRAINRKEIVALAISYIGIIIVFAEAFSLDGANIIIGASFVFGSAIAFAIYLIGSGVMVKRIGSTRFTAYAMSIACVATLFHFALDFDSGILELPTEVYGLTLLMAVLSTVIPAFLMNEGIQRIGANPASIISSLGPVMTIFLAYLLLDEQLSLIQCIGALLVMVGVFVVTYKTKDEKQK